jgi:hypothetical protein
MEIATHNVADLDRRLGHIDTAIEEAANTALSAMEGQRRARAALWMSGIGRPVFSRSPDG